LPFREIKPPKDFIRIHDYGITISTSLKKYLYKEGKICSRIKIFIDEENHLVGFQPTNKDEGYKLSRSERHLSIKCAELQRKLNGEFYPFWSQKHGMLIFSYKKKNDRNV